MSTELLIGGESIPPGARATIELPVPQLYTHTPLTMPVQVMRGRRDGPRLSAPRRPGWWPLRCPVPRVSALSSTDRRTRRRCRARTAGRGNARGA